MSAGAGCASQLYASAVSPRRSCSGSGPPAVRRSGGRGDGGAGGSGHSGTPFSSHASHPPPPAQRQRCVSPAPAAPGPAWVVVPTRRPTRRVNPGGSAWCAPVPQVESGGAPLGPAAPPLPDLGAPQPLPELDAVTLREPVRQALGARRAEVTGWSAEPVHGGLSAECLCRPAPGPRLAPRAAAPLHWRGAGTRGVLLAVPPASSAGAGRNGAPARVYPQLGRSRF